MKSIFHSFLVDRQNKVVAIGNPFELPKVKEVYLETNKAKVALLLHDKRSGRTNIHV